MTMSIDSTLPSTGSAGSGSPTGMPLHPTQPIPPKSTTVKTDKPRPHVCQICTRSFARLEHLKRHERSHTKEKPFKCDVCERCFARRDLLLRHRQKLHASFPDSPRTAATAATTTTTAAARTTKRKSVSASSASSKRAKKVVQEKKEELEAVTSGANAPSGLSMALPDGPAVESPTSSNSCSPPALNPTVLRRVQNQNRARTMSFSAVSSTSYTTQQDVETWNSQADWHPAAPPQVGFSTPQLMPAQTSDSETNLDDFFNASDPLFINPQILGQGHSPTSRYAQFQEGFHEFYDHHHNNDQEHLHQQQQHHHHQSDGLIDETYSWLNDQKNHWLGNGNNEGLMINDGTLLNGSQFDMDHLKGQSQFVEFNNNNNSHDDYHRSSHSSVLSPPTTLNSGSDGGDTNPTSIGTPDMSDVLGLNFDKEVGGDVVMATTENGHQSIKHQNLWKLDQNLQPQGSHVITPQLRLHVLAVMSTPTPFSTSPPPHLPSTLDLQRYINHYLENFGKHLPFLHDSLEFTAENMPLALGMAAIGALYASEHANSLSIFEISRCCIHVYLENRRDSSSGKDDNNNININSEHSTPLWLVQALVLGVVYGLFSNSSMANDIAVAQANAVISLSKAAGLHLPPFQYVSVPDSNSSTLDKWHCFIQIQSRIRTMHVVHTICCMLATSYNVNTTLSSRDIKCGSPCDESLWTASNADSWWAIMKQKELDGSLKDAVEGPNFGDLLDKVVDKHQTIGELKVPQFTLLSLIYAQHLEIHNRRQQHDESKQDEACWLEKDRESLDKSIVAWETTWSLSPLSSLSPSSQYGPLMSDSIPLSLLAHVRVYVDLRKVKECFWKRQFDQMGQQLDQLCAPMVEGRLSKQFDALTEAASYAADAVSLWSKHLSSSWENTVPQTFIHKILTLFDCGLVMSEFLKRYEESASSDKSEGQVELWNRIRKILARVGDLVGGIDGSSGNGGHDDVLDIGDKMDVEPDASSSSLSPSSPKKLSNGRTSVLALEVVSKILSKGYIWPFALVMGNALQDRAEQIRNTIV